MAHRWVLVAVIALSGACSDDGDAAGPGVTIPIAPPAAGSEGAAIDGRLVIEGGCMVIETEQGMVPVLWPAGTVGDRGSVTTGLRSADVGSDVTLGGGESAADSDAALANDALQSCVDKTGSPVVWVASGLIDPLPP
jgi:hypothetical protein